MGIPCSDPDAIKQLVAQPDNRRLLAYCRLMENPTDSLAWASLLHLTPGVGDTFFDYVYSQARESQSTFGEALPHVCKAGSGAPMVARPLRFGPTRVRVLLLMENGREEDRSREAQTTHAGADRQEAQGGRQVVGRGHRVAGGCKALEVSEATYHRWRAQFGGMKADDVKRLKELERENAQLKRLVADKELENLALREISKGNW